MARPIFVLSDELASQIAAGEVVERPASVVKELVENALDAGAKRVDVSIEAGGLALIEVVDDGRGMNAEDAPRSLERHATSKLREFSDLEEIASYGFRGEALPSIASVSRLLIQTRSQDADSALCLAVEGALVPQISPAGRPVGTSIFVRDLFFNVPARRKFLKSSNTESGHVSNVVVDAALSRFDVAFTLHRDGRKQKNFPRATNRRERVEQVLSDDELLHCQGERGPLVVEAFLCGADKARRGAGGLKILVNGRPVHDRSLSGTIAHAFGGSLERGRYPRGVVYLDLPGRLVDVNVHPQKTEVRFASARAVLDALHSVISRASPSGEGTKAGSATAELSPRGQAFEVASRSRGASESRAPSLSDEVSNRDGKLSPFGSRAQILRDGAASASHCLPAAPQVRSGFAPHEPAEASPSLSSKNGKVSVSPSPASHAAAVAIETGGQSRGLRFLAAADDGYLICAGLDGIYVLDQCSVYEKIILDELEVGASKGKVSSQVLLFPVTLDVAPKESDWCVELADELRAFGLDVRVRSETSISVHGVPKMLVKTGPVELIRLLLSQHAGHFEDLEQLMKMVFRGWARAESKAEMKAFAAGAQPIGEQEARALLIRFESLELSVEERLDSCLLSSTSFKELARKRGAR